MNNGYLEVSSEMLNGLRRFGKLDRPIREFVYFFRRMTGRFSVEDQLRLAGCMCEPPMAFLRQGCLIPHAYGITLSADEIGADCYIGQNVTVGTNGKEMEIGESTQGYKPKIGNLVRIFAGAVVSGNIRLGEGTIVAANAFVDKDVPDYSIVYGYNRIMQQQPHHKKILKSQLFHCINVYRLVPGMIYRDGQLYVDSNWATKRQSLFESLL